MDRFATALLKFLLILLLAPLAVCLALRFLVTLVGVALPWLVASVLLAAVGAGIGAGIVLARRGARRRSGMSPSTAAGPLGAYRVRRPKGGGWW